MKKIFKLAHYYFWAANGQYIADVQWVEWNSEAVRLKRIGKPLIQVTVVDPPPGRCPRCGEKVELTK